MFLWNVFKFVNSPERSCFRKLNEKLSYNIKHGDEGILVWDVCQDDIQKGHYSESQTNGAYHLWNCGDILVYLKLRCHVYSRDIWCNVLLPTVYSILFNNVSLMIRNGLEELSVIADKSLFILFTFGILSTSFGRIWSRIEWVQYIIVSLLYFIYI